MALLSRCQQGCGHTWWRACHGVTGAVGTRGVMPVAVSAGLRRGAVPQLCRGDATRSGSTGLSRSCRRGTVTSTGLTLACSAAGFRPGWAESQAGCANFFCFILQNSNNLNRTSGSRAEGFIVLGAVVISNTHFGMTNRSLLGDVYKKRKRKVLTWARGNVPCPCSVAATGSQGLAVLRGGGIAALTARSTA